MIPPIASNFVAGERPEDALRRASELEDREITAILNLLGEHYETAQPALDNTQAYVDLTQQIAEQDVDACLSVKPSQLGLDVSEQLFVQNIQRIAETADENGVFLWIDMEDHSTTDATIDAYESLVSEYPEQIGVCLQANLRRTESDIARLGDTTGKIRLVKGAYDEPNSISYTNGEAVDEEYKRLTERLLVDCEVSVALGTHDEEMIEHATSIAAEHDCEFDVQMLMGVREEYQTELTATRDVYQYVPYGGKWMSYFYRRVRERSENMEFAARAVLDQYF